MHYINGWWLGVGSVGDRFVVAWLEFVGDSDSETLFFGEADDV